MEQNSLILVVNNLSQREQTREIFGQTERKMFTRIAAIKAENVSSDTGQPFRQFPIKLNYFINQLHPLKIPFGFFM